MGEGGGGGGGVRSLQSGENSSKRDSGEDQR